MTKNNHYDTKFYHVKPIKRKLLEDRAISLCNDCPSFRERLGFLFFLGLSYGYCSACDRKLENPSRGRIRFDAGGDWEFNVYGISEWCLLEDQDIEPKPKGIPDDWPEEYEWHKYWTPKKNIEWLRCWSRDKYKLKPQEEQG